MYMEKGKLRLQFLLIKLYESNLYHVVDASLVQMTSSVNGESLLVAVLFTFRDNVFPYRDYNT